MNNDKRKKGCPNTACHMHKNKVMQKLDNEYCPKCGTKLIYVCAKCFSEIQDIDIKHRICKNCEIAKEEKAMKRKEMAKKAIAPVTAVAAIAVNSFKQEGEKEIKKAAASIGKKVVKNILKVKK